MGNCETQITHEPPQHSTMTTTVLTARASTAARDIRQEMFDSLSQNNVTAVRELISSSGGHFDFTGLYYAFGWCAYSYLSYAITLSVTENANEMISQLVEAGHPIDGPYVCFGGEGYISDVDFCLMNFEIPTVRRGLDAIVSASIKTQQTSLLLEMIVDSPNRKKLFEVGDAENLRTLKPIIGQLYKKDAEFINVSMKKLIEKGSKELIEALLETTAIGLNEQDDDGNTFLHVACSHSQSKIAILLLQAGANDCIRNNAGETACDVLKINRADDPKVPELTALFTQHRHNPTHVELQYSSSRDEK